MNLKIFYTIILILLIGSVSASRFVGSFTIKETEKQDQGGNFFKEFFKKISLIGNFLVLQSKFKINGPPICYNISNQELNKNTPLTLNLSEFFDDPNTDDKLAYSPNKTYDHVTITINNEQELANFTPEFEFVGEIPDVVIRATDPLGEFCDSNPFKLIIKGQPPISQSQQGGSSGIGSGGGPIKKIPNFILNKNVIELEMYPLDISNENVTVSNIGETPLNIKIINDFPGFIQLIIKEFLLQIREQKQIDFIISAPDIEPDIYTGKIKFIAEGITRTLIIVINLLEKGSQILLDVIIPLEYQRINPGDEVKARTIISTRDIPKNIEISYQIRDIEGNILTAENGELVLQESRTETEKTLKTKPEYKTSFYQFYVKVITEENEYTSAGIFEISLEPKEEKPFPITLRQLFIIIGIGGAIILVVLLIFFTQTNTFRTWVENIKKTTRIPKLSKIQIRLITIKKLISLYQSPNKKYYAKRYLAIVREFLTSYYSLRYKFTIEEAIKELKVKKGNKDLIDMLSKIRFLFYTKEEPTKEKMDEIIKETMKILKGHSSLKR